MSSWKLYTRLREAAAGLTGHVPTYLTSLPAPTEGDYPLRKRQEDQLYRALCQRGSAIMLHGPGGMGKTHMARSLFYRLRRKYQRLAWVEYGTDLRTSLTPVPQEGLTENPDARFARFMKVLGEDPRNTILFIDDAKECAADDPALAQITGMGITIFLTSRCPEIRPYESRKLEKVTVSECVGLFYANYREDPGRGCRKTVEALVESLDRNVFAVLLLARVAGKKENLPRIARQLRSGDLMDHIGQMMECAELTAEQEQLLRCLALTNSGELDEDLVSWMEFPDSDVEALVRKGWLVRNRETECLVLHDLVREYYRQEPPDRRTLERFIKGALGEDFHSGAKAHAPAAFKGKALDFQVRAVELMEQYWDSKVDLARACNNVGSGFSRFGDHRRALEFHRKALEIRERVLPPDHPDLAISYNNVGSTYDDLGDHAKALEFLRKALEIQEKVLSPDHPDLAISYGNVGSIYGKLGDYPKALDFRWRALEIHERVLSSDDPDLATSYNNLGYTYGKLGDRDKQLEYYRKALEIRERVLSRNDPLIAQSSSNIAVVYEEQQQYETALGWMRRALEIAEHSLPEDHPDRRAYREGIEYLEKQC